MKALLIRVFVVALLLCGGAGNVFATSDGKPSEALSEHLYCSVGGFLEGNVGLLIGLMLVFMGLWALIQGAKIVAVVPLLIIGSLITALPSLIESSMIGLGTLLKETQISKANFEPPKCTADKSFEDKMKDAMTDPQTGSFYPSHGSPSLNCKDDGRKIGC